MNVLKELYNKYIGWIVIFVIVAPIIVVLDMKILKLVKLVIRDFSKWNL